MATFEEISPNQNQFKSIVTGLIYDPRAINKLNFTDVCNITDALSKNLAALSLASVSKGVNSLTEIPLITISDYSTQHNLLPQSIENCRQKSYFERLMLAGENNNYLKPPSSFETLPSVVKHKSFDAAYMFRFRKNAQVKPSSFSSYFTHERRGSLKKYNLARRCSENFVKSTINPYGYSLRQRLQLTNNYCLVPEQYYRIGQTTLYWRSLPAKESEATPLADISHRDRLIVLYCTNFNGTHKLKPLVIGSSRDPRVIGHFEAFVEYRYSKYATISPKMLDDWFFQHFIHEVSVFLKSQGLTQKAILFLDPSVDQHPPLTQLISHKHHMRAVKLSTDIAVDQTVVGLARIEYKKRLLIDAVACPNKSAKLGDAIAIIRLAWDTVRPYAIEKCCRYVLPSEDRSGFPETNPTAILRAMQLQHITKLEIQRLLFCMPGGKEFDKCDIDNWIYYDEGYIDNKNPFF
ncbi:jerky protein homolog-like [Episyrphus balteatus]|uniref:jerky protein homolog-like n=1 Tax=Episyrphus balteatus TaxID=286459 RepID=UPI002486173A|nr:jerky protein homolog-like [Episyrphus balteatus]